MSSIFKNVVADATDKNKLVGKCLIIVKVIDPF